MNSSAFPPVSLGMSNVIKKRRESMVGKIRRFSSLNGNRLQKLLLLFVSSESCSIVVSEIMWLDDSYQFDSNLVLL